MVIDSKLRPRWLLKKSFPPYAYLPGRQPGSSLADCASRQSIAHALQGLILLSAAGVKIREDKPAAAQRHARRAAEQFRRLTTDPAFERALGLAPVELADSAEAAVATFAALRATAAGQIEPVFDFILGPPA
jgi:hypothetical protein